MKLFKQINEFEQSLEDVPSIDTETTSVSPLEDLRRYKAPLIILLNIIKIFTGKRADEKIDKMIEVLGYTL